MTKYINNYLNYDKELINPYDDKFKLNYFISEKEFNINLNILFSGFYDFFKDCFIINVDNLLIEHNINNIKKIKIFYYGNAFYNNLRFLIGKYYRLKFSLQI